MRIRENFLALPPSRLDVAEHLLREHFSITEIEKILSATGIHSLSRENSRMFTKFVFDAVMAIGASYPEALRNIDAVLVVSQSFDQRLPSLSTRVKEMLALSDDTFCIDIMDGCSGFIKAISLCSMLQSVGRSRALVITGDLNSQFVNQSEVGTRVLFGDGLGICVIDLDGEPAEWQVRNKGDHESTIACSQSAGPLVMNGFEVFRFTRGVVTPFVREFVCAHGPTVENFDLIALHQASKLVVDFIAKSLDLPEVVCPLFNASDFGNIGAGSISGWLARAPLEIGSQYRLLAIGFGSGLSWGAAVLEVELQYKGEICA